MIKCYYFLISLLLAIAYSSESPSLNAVGITNYRDASKWVQSNYKAETIYPDSYKIYQVSYYREGEFMQIYFRSNKRKGYLYHQVNSVFWHQFKTAKSKADFYQRFIKGNKDIYLSMPK